MSIKSRKSDPKFIRAVERGILRSAFVSLFWSVFIYRKQKDGLTLQALAKSIPANKAEVSRWFKGDPNWTINTIASIANALDVELKIEAIDRHSKAVFTPAGPKIATTVEYVNTKPTIRVKPSPIFRTLPLGVIVEATADAA